jgi:hypothetical protein
MMKPVEIIYEPVPVSRIGIRKEDGEVFAGTDYSCFAHMLEEYISVGTMKIVIPRSSPEAMMVPDVPNLIARSLKIIDDHKENEATARLLYGLRKEFSLDLTEDTNELKFPEHARSVKSAAAAPANKEPDVRQGIELIHRDVKRLALGFNHGIAIDFDTEKSLKIMRFVRNKTQSAEVRSVIAQLEGILSRYEPVSFGSAFPRDSTPKQLISLFDRLVNDPDYVAFSNNVSQLSSPGTRARALVEIRDYTRMISTKKFFGTSWDYMTKLLKIWPGVPLPESKDIASFVGGREAPLVVNMLEARIRAVESWRSTTRSSVPLRRDGGRLSDETIDWLPPLASAKPGGSHYAPIAGTVGDLLRQLQEYESKHKADR